MGSHAYDYTPDESRFDQHGVEAQAHMVEDWYARGESLLDPLYPYIRDNIRTGNVHAQEHFTTSAKRALTYNPHSAAR